MLDLNISHKKLIKKYLSEYKYDDIQSYENKGTILYQYYLDIKVRTKSKLSAEDELEKIFKEIFDDYNNKPQDNFEKHIDKINELWIARRVLALQLGKFTIRSGKFSKYLKAIKDYHLVQCKIFKLKLKLLKDNILLFLSFIPWIKAPGPVDLFPRLLDKRNGKVT